MSFGVSGKYRLDRRLGGGGMAEVFVGSAMGAEGFSRKVAIKRVLPGFSNNEGFAQLFVMEAQISSQLVHPNIVSVLDFDRDAEGRLFLVMELIDGKDLDALLATGMLPLPVVIFVISEVLRGLGFAHDLPTGADLRGLVHRDISPHNVLLSWEGAVKVSDFGIAKVRAASAATASGFLKGKPAYMSPEQVNGDRLDGRSDLFAVGVVLWEMLIGRRLFVAEDTRTLLAAVLLGQIPRPRVLRPDVPKDLERVTMKLLERDLPRRYATAEEVIADLMNCTHAPRDGREVLMATLAERFPDSAPVRQNVVRARSLGTPPTPIPGTLPFYAPPKLGSAGGPATPQATPPSSSPASTLPGLGTVMSAPTRARQVPPRPRLAQILIVLAVAITSGVISFAIVSVMKHPAPRSPRGAAPASATDKAAGPLDAPSESAPHDAGLPDAPRSGAITVPSRYPVAENSSGNSPHRAPVDPHGHRRSQRTQ
jgi:serine/threonine protein kinase